VISPQEASRLIERRCKPLGTTRVTLDDSLGHVLAENVSAPFPFPLFDNSAMDGFALRAQDVARAHGDAPVRLSIRDTVFAGGNKATLRAGQTCRIMTGAPVPRGADTILPVEDAVVERAVLVVERPVAKGRHVRRRGEDFRSGARVLAKGKPIHPGVIACLASLGRDTVRVVRRPRVAVIATGDETVRPGGRLISGQIYDSNSHMMAAMIRQAGLAPERVRRVKDHRGALKNAIRAALDKCDVVITTGGVSMGEHDYLREVLSEIGVKEVFWRVRQKPGKPIYFGAKGKKLVFGLPGNPASCFTCFYVYVYPALLRLSGFGDDADLEGEDRLIDVAVDAGPRWQLLRARADRDRRGGVERLERQGSHMVSTLADTDRLIVVPGDRRKVRAGARVTTLRLPHAKERNR